MAIESEPMITSTDQEMPRDETGNDDAARWEAAAQVRQDHPRWVVIWVARKNQYQARPTFPAPAGTVVIGVTPEALVAEIVRFEKRRPCASRAARQSQSRPEDTQ
jgi:hypothetical protein